MWEFSHKGSLRIIGVSHSFENIFIHLIEWFFLSTCDTFSYQKKTIDGLKKKSQCFNIETKKVETNSFHDWLFYQLLFIQYYRMILNVHDYN